MDPTPFLTDLEQRLDPAVEEGLAADWERFLAGDWPEPLFRPRRLRPAPARIAWPEIHVNDCQDDEDLMVIRQFRMVSDHLQAGDGCALGVRCDYGTPILPSLFGVQPILMDRAMNTLPGSLPLGAAAAKALVAAGQPALESGLGAKVFATGRRFSEIRRHFPRIGRHVAIYHPDLQGPLDILELIWGSELFLSLADEPDAVHALLDLITGTYIAFMRRWDELVGLGDGRSTVHWSFRHSGRIMLRNDSAMNLSGAMYAEFGRPYDERCFAACGGGAMHACGRVHHYLDRLPDVTAFNMSQPQLNDLERVFRHTIDRGILLLGLDARVAEQALAGGRDLRRRVHAV